MRYRLLSLCLFISLPTDANTLIYDDMMNNYCSSFFEDIPSCLNKYQQSVLKQGVDVKLEDIYVENAIEKAFEDGEFTVHNSADGYRLVQSIVNPMVDNTYIENRHHVFYFNPEMNNIEHILLDFRHGLYGGSNKQIDHEVVRIERIQASIEERNEIIYMAPSWPTFDYKPLNLEGFKLYRYKMNNGGVYVTPNYVDLPDSVGSGGEWWPTKGHQPSLENYNLASSSTHKNINGNGSFDTGIQFGYGVYLLVKFNNDKTIDLISPSRDNNGLLTTNPKDTRTMFPISERELAKPELLNDGWILNTSEFEVEQYSDFTSRFATTIVGNHPRFICRFEKLKDGYNHMLFGYVKVLYQDKYKKEAICTAGDDVYLMTKNGQKEPVKSEVNTFEWLSLKDTKLTGEKVTTKYERPLCSINLNNFQGVGLLNKKGQCEQDGNVFWSNDKRWGSSQNVTEYYYK